MVTRPDLKDAPYCSNCGYQLTGLTESSKCPECGKPLVDVLTRNTRYSGGKRWRSRLQLGGWPLIDIAMGPHGGELRGHARGVIAIGDIATGGVAIGGMARGVVALGGMAMGVFSFGGCSLGLAAMGGLAVGGVASGGMGIGILALGGSAMGYMAVGSAAYGLHALGPAGYNTPAAQQLLGSLGFVPGKDMMGAIMGTLVVVIVAALAVGGAIASYALIRVSGDEWRSSGEQSPR